MKYFSPPVFLLRKNPAPSSEGAFIIANRVEVFPNLVVILQILLPHLVFRQILRGTCGIMQKQGRDSDAPQRQWHRPSHPVGNPPGFLPPTPQRVPRPVPSKDAVHPLRLRHR